MFVSAHAAAQPRSHLGLKAGDTVSVRAAILSLVTKSANDVAIVLAEAIAGDKSAFVEQMNVKARDIGMAKAEF